MLRWVAGAVLGVFVFAPTARGQVTPNTVAFYNFTGTPGTTVPTIVDSGPNGLNGTVVGNLRFSGNTPNYSVAGSSSLNATADFDFGRVAHSASFVTPAFTIEAFARPLYTGNPATGGATGHTILTKLNASGGGNFLSMYSLGYDPTTLRYDTQVGFAGGIGIGIASTNTFGDGTWRHVAASYGQEGANGVLRLYVDGVLEAQASTLYQAPSFGNQPLYIGAGNYGGENGDFRRNFLGEIDAIRISDAVLPPTAFLIVPVPEPSSVLLVSVGAMGLVRWGRKRLSRRSELR